MYHFELTPSHKHERWDSEVEKFFDVFSRKETFAPACEICDEDSFYMISLDIPGLKKDEINIEVKDNHLYVTGERKAFSKTEKNNILRSERTYGKFERVFSLPQNINADKIEAKFENGVLDISLPKEEKSQKRKITISEKSHETPNMKN